MQRRMVGARALIAAPPMSARSARCPAGTRAGSKCSEEGRDVACEAHGLFGRGEVSAARHGGPLTDVVEAFGPLARWGALGDELVGEDGDHGDRRLASALSTAVDGAP